VSVDTAEARRLPGVAAVVVAADVPRNGLIVRASWRWRCRSSPRIVSGTPGSRSR
jgi:hypothetical protein